MRLVIEDIRGVWRCQLDSRTHFADTLEELLLKLAPDAPEDYVWHAAEVLGAILGAEVVEVPQVANDIGESILEWLREHPAEDPWQPTDEQRAYFENERTAEADQFVVEDDGA